MKVYDLCQMLEEAKREQEKLKDLVDAGHNDLTTVELAGVANLLLRMRLYIEEQGVILSQK